MRNIQLFGLIGYLRGLYFYIPIFTFFLLAEDVSLQAIIMSQAVYSLSIFLGEVPTGLLADRFGQKKSILLGYLVEVIGILLIVVFPSTAGLYASAALRGMGGAFFSGSEEALIFESVRATGANNFQKIYGRFLSNDQIGFIASTILGGLAYQYFGVHSYVPLIILTAVCVGAAGLLSLLLTDYRAQTVGGTQGSTMFSSLRDSFTLIRFNSTILTLTVIGVLTLSGEYFMQSVYQPYFETHGVPAFWMGAVLAIGAVCNIITNRYAYVLERIFTLEKILLIINLTLGVSYMLVALFVHPVFLVGCYVLMMGLFNLQVPIVSDYINSRTRSDIRSTVLSGVSFVQRFFQMFMTAALGLSVAVLGVETSLVIQGMYLIVGIAVGYYLLVRCGCTYKVANSEGEEFEFDRARL